MTNKRQTDRQSREMSDGLIKKMMRKKMVSLRLSFVSCTKRMQMTNEQISKRRTTKRLLHIKKAKEEWKEERKEESVWLVEFSLFFLFSKCCWSVGLTLIWWFDRTINDVNKKEEEFENKNFFLWTINWQSNGDESNWQNE